MVTIAQRIETLRTERNMNRPALAAALGFPKTAIEKFETGRQTPTQEQQEKLASFFGVSVFYLRGESNDRTKMENWMDMSFEDDGPGHVPMSAPKAKTRAAAQPQSTGSGQGMFDSFLNSSKFKECLREAVFDALRSEEGQELLAKAIRRELMKQK